VELGFLWPSFLFLLLLVPLVVLAYVLVLKRRKRFAVPFSSLMLIREAAPARSNWRRHLPFALFLMSLACLTLALARPNATVNVASSRGTVILALDVSGSMCSSDIAPNRLTVAQGAAENFIQNQPSGMQIGIVVFAGFAELVVPPTSDRELLLDEVRNLRTARYTAIGSAILRSLDAIAEVNDEVAPVEAFILGSTESGDGFADAFLSPEVQPDIIVLLTDGASNRGTLPLDAAQAAVDRGIRIYTIGFGTPRGLRSNCTLRQLGGFEFGFGGGFGRGGQGGFRRALDEATLQQIAEMTRGEYYLAESAEELVDVFETVPARLEITQDKTEVSVVLVITGALLAFAALVLAQLWNFYPR
jgi:Ca-activated chloride channel family protein